MSRSVRTVPVHLAWWLALACSAPAPLDRCREDPMRELAQGSDRDDPFRVSQPLDRRIEPPLDGDEPLNRWGCVPALEADLAGPRAVRASPPFEDCTATLEAGRTEIGSVEHAPGTPERACPDWMDMYVVARFSAEVTRDVRARGNPGACCYFTRWRLMP